MTVRITLDRHTIRALIDGKCERRYRGGRLDTIDATFNGEYQRWIQRPAGVDSWRTAA